MPINKIAFNERLEFDFLTIQNYLDVVFLKFSLITHVFYYIGSQIQKTIVAFKKHPAIYSSYVDNL